MQAFPFSVHGNSWELNIQFYILGCRKQIAKGTENRKMIYGPISSTVNQICYQTVHTGTDFAERTELLIKICYQIISSEMITCMQQVFATCISSTSL